MVKVGRERGVDGQESWVWSGDGEREKRRAWMVCKGDEVEGKGDGGEYEWGRVVNGGGWWVMGRREMGEYGGEGGMGQGGCNNVRLRPLLSLLGNSSA